MSDKRITDIYDICPVCGTPSETFGNGCRDCGYPIGKDWATVEMDVETHVIVRTVIHAQVDEVKK